MSVRMTAIAALAALVAAGAVLGGLAVGQGRAAGEPPLPAPLSPENAFIQTTRINMQLDAEAMSRFGVSVEDVTAALKAYGDSHAEVKVEDLLNLQVRTSAGALTPLRTFASIREIPAEGVAREPEGAAKPIAEPVPAAVKDGSETVLTYDLPPAADKTKPLDLKEIQRIILARIDPTGKLGYAVRPAGENRLAVVLPGRATAVTLVPEVVVVKGAAVRAQLDPPMDLEDARSLLVPAVGRKGRPQDLTAVGTQAAGTRWKEIEVFLAPLPADADPAEADPAEVLRRMVPRALAVHPDLARVRRLIERPDHFEMRITADRDKDKADFDSIVKLKEAGKPPNDPQWKWYPLRRGWLWTEAGNIWHFIYFARLSSTDPADVLVWVGDGQDVTGKDVEKAFATVQDGQPIVTFKLKPEAAFRFAKLTSSEMTGRHLAMIVDGVIQSAPVLRGTLSTGGIIEGYNSEAEAAEVAAILSAGELPALAPPRIEVHPAPPAK
jgi:hypothetical protein